MDDEVERLKRQAEIRKRRLLERSSDRLRLIYPNYEESVNSESLESITNDRHVKLPKIGLTENVDDGDYNDSNKVSDDNFEELNSSRTSTNSTFPTFHQSKNEKQDSNSDLKIISYLEYWNRGKFNSLRKSGSCVLGVLLFLIHHFVPDSFSFQFLFSQFRINSTSGIVSFLIYQFLISQLYLYSYFYTYYGSTCSSNKESKKWHHFILGCKNIQKVDYFEIINYFIQYVFAIRNLISEWFLLVTFYSFASFIYKFCIPT